MSWSVVPPTPPPVGEVERTVALVITNKANKLRFFHLYENFYVVFAYPPRSIRFETPDPRYTVTSPGTADKAVTVGSMVSRLNFSNISNATVTASAALNAVSAFSGRGPRVDQNPYGLTNFYEVMPYNPSVYYKPDIVMPGELVFSVYDTYIRETYSNGPPPRFSGSPALTSLWWQSLPSKVTYDGRPYYTNDALNNKTCNYYCPADTQGKVKDYWTNLGTIVSATGTWYGSGTSPASAIGAGSAAMILSRWPGLQRAELIWYLRGRPSSGSGTFPYKYDTGFGKPSLWDLFSSGIDDTPSLHIYYPDIDDATVPVTNSTVSLTGDYMQVYTIVSFTAQNFANGFSSDVSYNTVSNRYWRMNNIPLNSYTVNPVYVSYQNSRVEGGPQMLGRMLYVKHQHGLAIPTVVVTNPTVSIISNAVVTTTISGTWQDDSTVTAISWFNNSLGIGGVGSFVSVGRSGTWSAVIPLDVNSMNTITVSAIDDDAFSGSAQIVIQNGDRARSLTVSKLKYYVKRSTPGKDWISFKGAMSMQGSDVPMLFGAASNFVLNLAATTNSIIVSSTNLNAFTVKENSALTKGKKAIYSMPDPKQGKVTVSAKTKYGATTLNFTAKLKNLTDLAMLLNLPHVDVKKKQKLTLQGTRVKIIIGEKQFSGTQLVNSSYWGTTNKWTRGEQQ